MREVGVLMRHAALLEDLGVRGTPGRRRSRPERHSQIQRCQVMTRQVIAKITGRQADNSGTSLHEIKVSTPCVPDETLFLSEKASGGVHEHLLSAPAKPTRSTAAFLGDDSRCKGSPKDHDNLYRRTGARRISSCGVYVLP
jgi:hypothetical protein